MTESDVMRAINDFYKKKNGWLVFCQLRMGTGWKGHSLVRPNNPDAERRIDAFAINVYPATNYMRVAFEIKTSFNDFRQELKDKTKRRPAFQFSNQYYFITPQNLIPPDSIPMDAGLVEIDGKQNLNIKVVAPWHDNAPSWAFLASVIRSLTDDHLNMDFDEC